jgi:hypothetical protein
VCEESKKQVQLVTLIRLFYVICSPFLLLVLNCDFPTTIFEQCVCFFFVAAVKGFVSFTEKLK